MILKTGCPLNENGLTGIFDQDLISILIHRMQGFQSGLYACGTTAEALSHLNKASECLRSRTNERKKRGVIGTSTK